VKKTVAAMIIGLAATCAYSQVQIGDFKDAFKDFATDMAGSLAVASTIGSNWSDAYVGSFPHMGLGLTVGATTVSADSTSKLFSSMGADTPDGIDSVGIPIPVAVGTFKIGLPYIPMDLGFKLGFLPSSIAKSLMDSSGSSIKYLNWGLQARYALVKQGPGLKPNVSVGLAYNHVTGEITVPTGMDSQDYKFEGTPYYISASEPKMDLSWKSNTIDLTAQVSKKFIIIVPYIGTGLTFGKSSVEGGIDSDITTNYPGGIDALKSYLGKYGISVPDELSSSGFSYTADESTPLLRFYGGMSFRLFIIDLDAQAIYVLKSKSFGASLTGRLQF
jgi:hypothetical protein